MAQCFVSTYRDHFRWQDPKVPPSCKPVDGFVTALPQEDNWLGTTVADDEEDANAVENRLHRRYLKRMITTYQVYYCREMFSHLLHESTSKSFENQLLESFKDVYEPDPRRKILPPLVGSRKIFGPTRSYYTPMTQYQLDVGKNGYAILKGEKKKELSPEERGGETKLCDCKNQQ